MFFFSRQSSQQYFPKGPSFGTMHSQAGWAHFVWSAMCSTLLFSRAVSARIPCGLAASFEHTSVAALLHPLRPAAGTSRRAWP